MDKLLLKTLEMYAYHGQAEHTICNLINTKKSGDFNACHMKDNHVYLFPCFCDAIFSNSNLL